MDNGLSEVNLHFELLIISQVYLLCHGTVFSQQVAAGRRVTCALQPARTFLTDKVGDLVYCVRLVLQDRLNYKRVKIGIDYRTPSRWRMCLFIDCYGKILQFLPDWKILVTVKGRIDGSILMCEFVFQRKFY